MMKVTNKKTSIGPTGLLSTRSRSMASYFFSFIHREFNPGISREIRIDMG
jgi:hypothetical protein